MKKIAKKKAVKEIKEEVLTGDDFDDVPTPGGLAYEEAEENRNKHKNKFEGVPLEYAGE